jgi:hypothetical protein
LASAGGSREISWHFAVVASRATAFEFLKLAKHWGTIWRWLGLQIALSFSSRRHENISQSLKQRDAVDILRFSSLGTPTTWESFESWILSIEFESSKRSDASWRLCEEQKLETVAGCSRLILISWIGEGQISNALSSFEEQLLRDFDVDPLVDESIEPKTA